MFERLKAKIAKRKAERKAKRAKRDSLQSRIGKLNDAIPALKEELEARRKEALDFKIISAATWGRRDHNTYSYGPKPLRMIFIHTSVGNQLPPSATKEEEYAGMRSVDATGFSRGFNGISYNFGVFPSGRAYEGRGFGVVEAASEPYNSVSDSICCIGNTDIHDPTEDQIRAIVKIVKKGIANGWYAKPINVRGHREIAPKACPGAKWTDAMIEDVQKRVNA